MQDKTKLFLKENHMHSVDMLTKYAKNATNVLNIMGVFDAVDVHA